MLCVQVVQQGRGLRGADRAGGGGRQRRALLPAPGPREHHVRDMPQENVSPPTHIYTYLLYISTRYLLAVSYTMNVLKLSRLLAPGQHIFVEYQIIKSQQWPP